MDEYRLLELIKSGENDYFEELLRSYSKLINHIVSKNEVYWSIYPMLREDLLQEGSIALYQACMSYNNETDVKFSTFAYLVISRRIKKRVNEHLRRSSIELYSLDGVTEKDYLKNYVDKKYCYDRISLLERREKVFKYLNSLNEADKRIIELRQNNISYEEIAKELNISKKQVDNRLYSIKNKLRDYLKK